MRFVVFFAVAALAAYGQNNKVSIDAQEASVRAMQAAVEKQQQSVQQQSVSLMQASLNQQRESLRRQAAVAHQAEAVVTGKPVAASPANPAESSFFTVPWPSPVSMLQPFGPLECAPISHTQLAGLVRDAASQHDLSPDLLRAVIGKESAFRPCAVSRKGAMGLMQLMPETADLLKVRDPFDPKENVDAGSKLLKSLLERYGNNLAMALSAYNAGPASVDRAGGVPEYPETTNYVTDILGRLGIE